MSLSIQKNRIRYNYRGSNFRRCQDQTVLFHRIGIPDEYVHHGSQDVLRAQYDLHAEGIARRVREFLAGDREAEMPVAVGNGRS